MTAFPSQRPTTDADRDNMSRKHPTLELTEPFQSYLDSIPGAVFQMVTSSEGLVIEYPYIGEGCYKLLEITKSPTSDTALRVPHIQESESSQAHRFPTEQPSGAPENCLKRSIKMTARILG